MYIYGYHLGDSGMHSKAVIAHNLLKCKYTIIMFFFGAIISRRKFSSNCLSTKRCFAITIKCCLINFFSSFRFLGKITWCCRFRFLSFCEKKLAVSKHVPLWSVSGVYIWHIKKMITPIRYVLILSILLSDLFTTLERITWKLLLQFTSFPIFLVVGVWGALPFFFAASK